MLDQPSELDPRPGAQPDPEANAPLPPYVPMGVPPTEPLPRKRRLWVWAAVVAVVIVGVAAAVTGWVVTRPAPEAFPVGACVSFNDASGPMVNGCADSASTYKIVAKRAWTTPVVSACVQYPDATNLVAQPAGSGKTPTTVLCLAPTRFNTTDPGALRADDCVDVKNAGETITRVDCALTPAPAKVIAVEFHSAMPVTDQACKDHPEARVAYAQTALNRAVVVCAVDTDPKSVSTARVGDCTDRAPSANKVACTDPSAVDMVRSVRVVYQKPARPECAGDQGSNGVLVRSNQKTDLVVVVCLGPADQSDSRYAAVGDCILDRTAHPSTAADTGRIDCSDPKAAYQVTDVHESNDNVCPSGTVVSLTYAPGTTNGLTVCMRRH
ncbi:hypothetical protein ACFXHA_36475 [Nocardia sp. NPDC059240]|uniref:LppU/SCO3897 family protein n=1 Tax=Nocardia sp. NPDC059240 TaxID=3346786 RepID=UPI003694D0EF